MSEDVIYTVASFTERVARLFRSRPNEWIDADELQRVGGKHASRTRISNCRTDLGMTIENKLVYHREHQDACPALQAWDVEGACNCRRSKRWTQSLYRYVPAAPSGAADLNRAWSLEP